MPTETASARETVEFRSHPSSAPHKVLFRRSRTSQNFTQLLAFGSVGLIAFVIDLSVYNILRGTIMQDQPIGAKVASAAVSIVASWIGNRVFTFRATRSTSVFREGVLFVLMNLIGLGIAALCLFVSHYVLGYTSQLADNIAGNGVGLVLGTAFRFIAYRTVVFGSGSPVAEPRN